MMKTLVLAVLLYQCAASPGRETKAKKAPSAPEAGPFYGQLATYLVVNGKRSWGDAKSYCEHGGKLAQPDSKAANTELTDTLSAHGITGAVWIGLGDTWMEGLVSWTDGTEIQLGSYTNWGRPSGNSASKDCVLAKSGKSLSYQWYFERCSRTYRFICQMPPGCPDGTSPVSCFVNPCDMASCVGYPDAICRPNYCGGCNADFYNTSGMLVDCAAPPPVKPGTCPVQPETGVGACVQGCETDYDCARDEKCCANGCSFTCTAPI